MKIEFSSFKNDKIIAGDSIIEIRTPILYFALLLPVTLFVGAITMLFFEKTGINIALSIVAFIISFFMLWNIYEPVNKLKIDRGKKYFTISSRIPIKYIFITKKEIQFTDITRFIINEYYNFGTKDHRYIVKASLKDSSQIPFTQSENKETAQNISHFLNLIIAVNNK